MISKVISFLESRKELRAKTRKLAEMEERYEALREAYGRLNEERLRAAQIEPYQEVA